MTDAKTRIELVCQNPFEEYNDIDQASVSYVDEADWQLHPEERSIRVRNLAWLAVSIHQSKSVHLSKIALKLHGYARLLSTVRRLNRFLSNAANRVREWIEPIPNDLPQYMASSVGEIRLIAGGTKVGFGHQLLVKGVAYRSRALPAGWTWVRAVRGHSSAAKQLELLAYVRQFMPAHIPVFAGGRQ